MEVSEISMFGNSKLYENVIYEGAKIGYTNVSTFGGKQA